MPGVAPGPAEAVVEHGEDVTDLHLANGSAIRRWRRAEWRRSRNRAVERLGIVRCDHPPGEPDVGEILAEGIENEVRRIGRTGKREFVSAGGRMLALGR